LTPREVNCCLWSCERHLRRYTGKVRNIRAVVHGHTTLARMEVLGNVYFIDTKGGSEHAQLTFLDLATLTVRQGPRPAR
jgi:serine/threonine protein phosphatase 1